jgi:transcriptional regulator GlxA family with amidase domain
MAEVRRIGIILFDGVEELDAVGPWEVLAAWTSTFPDDGFEVRCLSPTGGSVECAKGLVLGAHGAYDDPVALSALVHPGGIGTRRLMKDAAHLDRIGRWRAEASLVTSVCTGALVLAAAGLLKNRPATTHWASLDLLAETDPSIEVRPDDRFVDDGDVVTSAGVSAGIDMALHLVARLASKERAATVRRYIQYDPAPPA